MTNVVVDAPIHPVEGGSCSDYDYACGDPVNGLDLNGESYIRCGYTSCTFYLSRRDVQDFAKFIGQANTRIAITYLAGVFCSPFAGYGSILCATAVGAFLIAANDFVGTAARQKKCITASSGTRLGIGTTNGRYCRDV